MASLKESDVFGFSVPKEVTLKIVLYQRIIDVLHVPFLLSFSY